MAEMQIDVHESFSSGFLAYEVYGVVNRYNLESSIRIMCIWEGHGDLEGSVHIYSGIT